MGVGECQSEDSFVLVRNPHKGLALEILYETGRRWRKARTQGSQQKRAVNRRRGKVTVRDRCKDLGTVDSDAGLVNVREWLSVPGGCIGILLRYTLVIAHKKPHEGVTNFSLLALGANPSPWLSVLLFFHPQGWVCYELCVCKAMWNAPGQR